MTCPSSGTRKFFLRHHFSKNGEVSEDGGLAPETEDSRERCGCGSMQRLSKGGFFARTGSENPDLARGSDGRVTYGDAPGGWFECENGTKDGGAGQQISGFAGEERSDVALLA